MARLKVLIRAIEDRRLGVCLLPQRIQHGQTFSLGLFKSRLREVLGAMHSGLVKESFETYTQSPSHNRTNTKV